jgi:hypothetical protein
MSTQSRLARFGHLPSISPSLSSLPAAQRALWSRLGEVDASFVLYGGTGLALWLGHRESVDFDFFSAASFAPGELLDRLAWLGRLEIVKTQADTLVVREPGGVLVSFFGGMTLQSVAEPAIARDNGLVVASLHDLAGTKAKAILDRSEWKDYVDIATLLDRGLRLPEIIAYATTIFDQRFAFPGELFLRSLVWFGDGTAGDVPATVQVQLRDAVRATSLSGIPVVSPYRTSIEP